MRLFYLLSCHCRQHFWAFHSSIKSSLKNIQNYFLMTLKVTIFIKYPSRALSIIIKINRLNPFSWLPPWRVSDFIFVNFFISLFFTVEKLFLFIWREKLETINFIALSCSTFILFILPIARSLRHKSGIKISLKVDWVN